MTTDLYTRIAQGVSYGTVTPNEARELCGLEPIRYEDTWMVNKKAAITNCVNCGAVIDPNVDHCEYCGTSYKLMGIRCAPKKVSKRELLTRHAKLNAERRARLELDRLQVESELLQAKTKALSDAEEIKTIYEDALNAMRPYGRDY